jgi:hypothetical protein
MSVRLASKEVLYFSVDTDNVVVLSKLTFLHILRSVYQKGWLYFNEFFSIAHLEVADSKDKQGIC